MNKREKEILQKINLQLSELFDILESQSDSDLDFFEDEGEEIECAPVQYVARKLFAIAGRVERLLGND